LIGETSQSSIFSLESGIKGDAFLSDSNLNVVASSYDTVLFREFAVGRDREARQQLLEGSLVGNDFNHVIGSKEGSKGMLSVGVEGGVWLKLRVPLVCLIITSHSLASSTEADISSEGVRNSEFLEQIFLIRDSSVNDDVRSERHG
jgi:hypothetical protein